MRTPTDEHNEHETLEARFGTSQLVMHLNPTEWTASLGLPGHSFLPEL